MSNPSGAVPTVPRRKRPLLSTALAAWSIAIAAVGCEPEADLEPPVASSSAALTSPARASEVAADFDSRRGGAPPEVRAARREWPLAHRDYAGTRATFDSKLCRDNIGRLSQAWAYDLNPVEGIGSVTSSAIVLGGMVYLVDQMSNVLALDAQSGALLWEKRYEEPAIGPNGLAVGWGKLFTAAGERSFVALDLANGAELWRAPIEIPANGGIGIAPVAFGGLVYLSTVPVTSSSSYAGGVNGTLYALDQASGAIAWSFATVADPTLWGHPDINSGGGAWYPPTIDEAHAITYWGIGNPAPWPGTPEFPLGSSRPGPNLYTNSVVSLDARSGQLRWYHQETPHDLFDRDFQNPPLLYRAEIDGVERPLVVGSGKVGTVVALDPTCGGEVVWRTAVGRHENDALTEFGAEGVKVFPGALGGMDTPLAYADGTLYAPVVNWGTTYYPDSVDFDAFLADTNTGELVALDAATGGVRWKADLAAAPFGSVTVVNDLAVVSTFDSQVRAFDRHSGEEVWTWQAPSNINAPISVVGDTLFIPAGAGETPQLIALRLP